jgi:rare lipoprotein A
MMRARAKRWLLAVGCCAAFGLSGCHHAKTTYTASAPPPPPLPTRTESAPHRATPTPLSPAPARKPQPNAADDLAGPPISTEVGLASWYGPPYHNRQAADGSIFDQNALTAAHRTLPMGSTVRVTNLDTGESVVVKITDRGPFVTNRILDLSLAAAKAVGLYQKGVAKVKVEVYAHPGSDPAGRWCVQIGAFMTADDAIQLKNDLLSRYKTAKVIEFQGPTGYWVRINPAQADRLTASSIADSIHIPDASPYLVRTN